MNQAVVAQSKERSPEQSPGRRPNLALCFQELFTAIVRVRFNLQAVPNADAFRANAKNLIRMATQDSAGRGYAGEDAKLAAFAVVAFLDESVLTSKNPVFSTWSRMPLQEELFGEHMAGETSSSMRNSCSVAGIRPRRSMFSRSITSACCWAIEGVTDLRATANCERSWRASRAKRIACAAGTCPCRQGGHCLAILRSRSAAIHGCGGWSGYARSPRESEL